MAFLHGFSRKHISSIPPGGWSIANEIMFYTLLPVLLTKKVHNLKDCLKWISYICALWFIFKCLGRYYIVHHSRGGIDHLLIEEGWYFYFWFPNQASVFMLGILGYFFLKERKEIVHTWSWAFIFGAAIFTIVTYEVTFYHNKNMWIPVHFIFSLGFLCFLLFLSVNPWRIIVNPLTVFLGKISFSMYLLHFFILAEMEKFNLGPLMFILTSFALTVVSSFISYELIEKRGVTIGQKLINKTLVLLQTHPLVNPEGFPRIDLLFILLTKSFRFRCLLMLAKVTLLRASKRVNLRSIRFEEPSLITVFSTD